MTSPAAPLRLLPLCSSILLCLGACSSADIRLYELRDAEPGSPERAAYDRLAEAVELANEFLETSEFARGFPAGAAHLTLDHTDILIRIAGEGIFPMRIQTTGWADPRTFFGDGVHPTDNGFVTARRTDQEATGSETTDSAFLLLTPPEMAGLLLRQALTVHEIRVRGSFDYWINYNLLGLDPTIGWGEDSAVNLRAEAVMTAFEQWHAERTAAEVAG